MVNVLITGAMSFIGTHLVISNLHNGTTVRGQDTFQDGLKKILKWLKSLNLETYFQK